MKESAAKSSPQRRARLAGFCWLICFLTSVFGMFVGMEIVVAGDAAMTAANLLERETFFRSGTTAMVISSAFYVAATLLVYELLKPVTRTISALAAAFSLIGCAVGLIACLFDLVPLIALKSAQAATVFTAEQLQTIALLSLQVRRQTNDNIGLVFFGLHCFLVGYLILRSTFLPRAIGLLMVIAGLGWLTFLWPPLARSLAPYNMLPGAIGELSLILWLLVKGVHVPRWLEKAGLARG